MEAQTQKCSEHNTSPYYSALEYTSLVWDRSVFECRLDNVWNQSFKTPSKSNLSEDTFISITIKTHQKYK